MIKKRAMTDADKQVREQHIIDTAQTLLMTRGYNEINMNALAEAAGLAKGTLYLYFKTREELFLALYEQQLKHWVDDVRAELDPVEKLDNPGLVGLLVRSVLDRPQLTRLIALTPIILEQNISIERAYQHKTWLLKSVGELASQIEDVAGLPAGSGLPFLMRLHIFIAGLEGHVHPAPVIRDLYTQQPAFPRVTLAEELHTLLLAVLPA